jgi:endonuclease G
MCLLGFSSCPCAQQSIAPNPKSETKQDTISQQDTILIHCIPYRIELPEVKNMNWFIQHQYYAMEYDTAQRHSVWVAYKFYSDYNEKTVKRTDAWAFDPDIPKEFQSLNGKTQTYPGYDRGHLIASEDRVFNLDANKETFYFSNMSPQLGCFNQKIWKYLEGAVRKWAQSSDCDTLYVATGGAINPGVEILGKLEERNHVTIPKYYFKALVKRQGDSFTGIAFWLENRCYTNDKGKNITKVTHEYSMTIRELEEKTGINFFPYLRYLFSDKPNLEEEVETSMDITKWPL